MQFADYPALYKAADQASNRLQGYVTFSYKVHSSLLVAGSLISLVSTVSWVASLIAALLFLASLATHYWSQQRDFQGRWYQARALAESVKTSTWRFMMNADPFSNSSSQENRKSFEALLIELLSENRGIAGELAGGESSGQQITRGMVDVATKPTLEKLECYVAFRVQEQRNWYAEKSVTNRVAAKRFLIVIGVLYGLAIALLLVRIAFPDTPYFPIDALAVAASGTIGWSQLKRFNELASAYGLTAHEVGIIQTRANAVATKESLNNFVSDAENAFSREHTQWAARRDH